MLKIIKFPTLVSSITFAVLTSPALLAVESPGLNVLRVANYQQTSTTTVSLEATHPYVLFAGAWGLRANYFEKMQMTLPNTGFYKIPGDDPTGQSTEFNFEASYKTLSSFNTTFPVGHYTLDLIPYNGTTANFPLYISGLTFPPAPKVTNFTDGQSIPIASDFAVQWATFAGNTSKDRIMLQIRSSIVNDDYEYFSTPGIEQASALLGSATSASVPAGSLPPGVDLSVSLHFARNTAIGGGTIKYFSGSATGTSMTFHTAGTPDTTAPIIFSVSPLNNATGVSRTAPLTITFNEPMRTKNPSYSIIGTSRSTTSGWTNLNVFNIYPPAKGWPANTQISVTLNPLGFASGFTDLSRNPLATETLVFTTGN